MEEKANRRKKKAQKEMYGKARSQARELAVAGEWHKREIYRLAEQKIIWWSSFT